MEIYQIQNIHKPNGHVNKLRYEKLKNIQKSLAKHNCDLHLVRYSTGDYQLRITYSEPTKGGNTEAFVGRKTSDLWWMVELLEWDDNPSGNELFHFEWTE